jgi:hypothetical protein
VAFGAAGTWAAAAPVSAGAVAVQHDGAAAVAQHDDEPQQPPAWAEAAENAPIEVVANTRDRNFNMRNSFNENMETELSPPKPGPAPGRTGLTH